MNTAPTTGCHVFFSFELDRGIIGTNLLTKFHEDRTRNVASRVFTRKTAPTTGGHSLQALPNFKLDRGIIGTNLLSKFHEDRTRNVASRVLTRKTAPPTDGHVFQRTGTIFELDQHISKTNILTNFEIDRGIIGTNLLTKFHEDRTKNTDGQRPITIAHLSNQMS
ncbi:hypothetical protein DPMN_060833 [Dreissena polymorpha]|uniref:Uncharacterized protein n=1 Tax=Dreissena polymorpha TaxID=45954 RepID=A0A9D4C6N4_DREPO|nr:hypothetical protein DPMN_060833 [Dreissena polymorpha]